MWEVNKREAEKTSVLEKVKSCEIFAKEEATLKQVTTFSINANKDVILVGTQGGNIYLVDLKTLDLTDQIIYQDVVLQNIPDDYKVNPGPVEVVAEQPNNPEKYLIGYNRGLMVLWDNKILSADQFYIATQVCINSNYL